MEGLIFGILRYFISMLCHDWLLSSLKVMMRKCGRSQVCLIHYLNRQLPAEHHIVILICHFPLDNKFDLKMNN